MNTQEWKLTAKVRAELVERWIDGKLESNDFETCMEYMRL